jgi:2-hydroxy-6-oxonona-2,4-dienedioate hydrolase
VPVAQVNGADISYEIIGRGPLLVWTEGGRFGRNKLSYLFAGHFQRHYSVLLWDRRNAAGASEIALSADPWYVMTDAEDLAALLKHLDLGPAHLAGTSAGTSASLLVARAYPQIVQSLVLLHPPTDRHALAAPFAESWLQLAETAESGGMQAVIDTSQDTWDRERHGETLTFHTWPAESIHLNPKNRERLLAMDVDEFAETMRRWSDHIRAMIWPPGMTEEDLCQLECPTMIVPGRDTIHPRKVALRLAALISQARIADYPAESGAFSPESRVCKVFPEIETFLSGL